jgi:glycyl-tRNA synthetase (class II)
MAWVGNVQRFEVVAVLKAKIYNVTAFRRTKIPFALFRTGRTQAERNAITAHRFIIMLQVELPFVFDNENEIRPLSDLDRASRAGTKKYQRQYEREPHKRGTRENAPL